MPDRDFPDWMQDIQQQVEQALATALPHPDHAPQRLHQAMRYVTLGGGKRVRPLLVQAAGEMTGAQPQPLLQAACAVEMIHVYSLVHDDMPCMDDDVLRRGKATCHIEYDEATALLVGDALQTLAFDLLSRPQGDLGADTRLAMIQILAQSSGHTGMAGGQAIDLDSVGQTLNIAELEYMHCLKTGALIRAAIRMGAYCGRALDDEESDRLDHFAKHIGLAFQVVDDILDYEADTATLGKTAGKDAANDKPTYVSLLGLSQAKALAGDLYQDACDALAPFGTDNRRLLQLAEYIVARSF